MRALENELSIIGLSAHLMAVATKEIWVGTMVRKEGEIGKEECEAEKDSQEGREKTCNQGKTDEE